MQSLTQLAGCCEALSDRKLLLGTAIGLSDSWHVEAIRDRLPLTSKEESLVHGQHSARRLRTA